MAWDFEVGRTYNRRADIHARFGGQQQGGIVSPANYPLVIVITGEAGLLYGYEDRWRADGVFELFGEGQVGDMQFVRGNAAIRDHAINGEDLLLFSKHKEGLRFEGEMVCEAWHNEETRDRNGDLREAIVFELRPLEAIVEVVDAAPVDEAPDLEQLRRRAFEAAGPAVAAAGAPRTIYQRSRDVRDYVLARSKGECEGCAQPAPFVRRDGSPYLEPHHIRRVTDGGPDDPRYVIALCPTCHRRVHHGIDGVGYNDDLMARMQAIEHKAPPI